MRRLKRLTHGVNELVTKPSIIIPVENQIRELEPKLLLACIAAQRGYSSIIGSRLEIDFRIASFPRGLYLSKSMTARSIKMFNIMRKLGHRIAAWDEEALVHHPPEIYFGRRLSAVALGYISHLFAWGDDNAELFRQYPDYDGTPIHITGNPRGDMLRPELRTYFAAEAEQWRQRYGSFVLINTNFSQVNAYNPGQNLFLAPAGSEELRFGRAATGMSAQYVQGLHAYKKALFEAFQQMIPGLARAFPELNIVIRVHPVENPQPYLALAKDYPHLHVINEGNVLPWLMAAQAVIHNGCTTGLEAYALGATAISYRVIVDEEYDGYLAWLPNHLSYQCNHFDQLCEILQSLMTGAFTMPQDEEKTRLLDRYLMARSGPLACERMMDRIDTIYQTAESITSPPLSDRLEGWYLAHKRQLKKNLLARLPQSKYRPEFQRYRYPGATLDEMRARIERFSALLNFTQQFKVEPLHAHIYRISL